MVSKQPNESKLPHSTEIISEKASDVIIVEDDEIDQRLMRQSFDERGAPERIWLKFFKTGEQLISHLNQQKLWPSLLLCDINLPGISGLETIRQVANLSLNNKMPNIVVLSGSNPTLDPELKLTSHISAYYQKPASKRAWDNIIGEICHLYLKDNNNINGSMS